MPGARDVKLAAAGCAAIVQAVIISNSIDLTKELGKLAD